MAFDPETVTLEELRAQEPPEFADRDPAIIKARMVAFFEAETGRTLYPAQVEMLTIETVAYALSLVGEAHQAGFLQNRAIWATGRHLEELGAHTSTFKLAAQPARSRVQFQLVELRSTAVIVPTGTRVAAGTDLVFQTVSELVIAAGQLTGEVDIEAAQSGAAHNGLLPGQIEDVLDPVAFVTSVTNTIETGGGSDIEGEERFRLRVVNALERAAAAGSRQWYIEQTKSVNPSILDVEIIQPSPGYIEITPLMADGTASDAVDDTILAHFSPEDGRPMGDSVSTTKAVPTDFTVSMTLSVAPGSAGTVLAQAETVVRARFAEWQRVLGAQVAPSALVEVTRNISGVVGVDGPAFAFTDLPATQFARISEPVVINVVEVPNA